MRPARRRVGRRVCPPGGDALAGSLFPPGPGPTDSKKE
jgi:hypothetical protein